MFTFTILQIIWISVVVFLTAFVIAAAMWTNWIDYGDAFVDPKKKSK